ncbi:hypothetical protein GCM10009839_89410 [Catenulispora yoronensis]|uniref:Uncharacterized protein n=1 Tax=Catenulispora yoronensis TaxID=450799 RepID=A0ABP5H3T6_9ACTN
MEQCSPHGEVRPGPDRGSFETFFSQQEAAIRPMFESVQPTEQPTSMYWEEMATGDAYGWNA